jgi:hypothetical protein
MAVPTPREQALHDLEEAATRWAALHDPTAAILTVVATVESITAAGHFRRRRFTWRFDREESRRSA